jgi:hypothetical protein
MARKSLVTLPALILFLGAGSIGAAESAKEIQTAAQHAAFAAKGKTVAETHLHLHHVINCIVGPSGEGFDAQAGNPCQGQGAGALSDFAGPAEKKAMVEQALALAKVGVQIEAPGADRTTAHAVNLLLNGAGAARV